MDFVKNYEGIYRRPTNTLRTRPGRNACGRGLPAAASSLSKYAILGLNQTKLTMENSPSTSLARLPWK